MKFTSNIWCHNFFGFLTCCLLIYSHLEVQGATSSCKITTTPILSSNIKVKNFYFFNRHQIFEAEEGIHVKNRGPLTFLPFISADESVVTFEEQPNEKFYMITRTLRGYRLYLVERNFDYTYKMKEVYSKNLSFYYWGREYASSLVDLHISDTYVYVLTNFDIISYSRSDFFREGENGKYQKINSPFDARPNRAASFRKIDQSLQVIGFKKGNLNLPQVLWTIGPNIYDNKFLSSFFMKKIRTKPQHPLFIYALEDNISRILSEVLKHSLNVPRFVLAASSEYNNPSEGFVVIQSHDYKGEDRRLQVYDYGTLLCEESWKSKQLHIIRKYNDGVRVLSLHNQKVEQLDIKIR